ncbi:hypothetical protein Hanom_Chr10g00876061 [Helianthus anomalus]
MHIRYHNDVNWEALERIDETTRAHEFIQVDSRWDQLFELSYLPCFREILVEFFRLSNFTLVGPNDLRRWTTRAPPPAGYLHRLIATSRATRGKSQEWCTSGDLVFLYSLLLKGCALLLTVWRSTSPYAHHRPERGQLLDDACVTIIAHSMGLFPDGDAHLRPLIEPASLGLSTIGSTLRTTTSTC